MSKDTLKELVILPLQRPELFCKGQMTKPCKGILLIGPPRTGKTMLAKAVGNFINVSMSSITSKWFGEGGEYVKAVFSLASKIAPSVIFVDEVSHVTLHFIRLPHSQYQFSKVVFFFLAKVDSMLGRRVNPGEHEAMHKMKNEFMVNWDGLRTKYTERVLALTPTNRPFDLDEVHRLNMTDGYSGNDLKNLCYLLQPCKGILLFGPPGTGKTMLAKAVTKFINISMSSITAKWFGEGGEYVKAVFSMASKIAPSVIFVDEVDSMLGRRVNPGEHEAMRKMKNEFMVNWDGLRTKYTERVLVLTPTNRPFDLDEVHRLNMTDGYSGSDLKNLCYLLQPCKGILLFGPPGTGKTMLAKAVTKFINISMSSITAKWFGEVGEYVKAVFSLGSKIAPSVIFVDKVDSMLGRRENPGEHEAMRNEFMVNWEGLLRTKDTERVLVPAPLTLTVRTDASWSDLLDTWFVSVLIIDSRQTIVFCSCFFKVEDPNEDPISFQGELYGFCCAMMIVQKMSLSHLLDPHFAAVKFISDSADMVEQINGLGRSKNNYEKLEEMSLGVGAWKFLLMQKFEVELQHRKSDFNKFCDQMAKLVRFEAEKDCSRRGKDILFREGYYTNINGIHVDIKGINVEDGGLGIARFLPDEVKKKYNIKS